jgi:hypothetical protein
MGTRAKTRTTGGGWFVFMVGMWIAFGVLALAYGETLEGIWEWVGSLPVWGKVGIWIIALPWMLALVVMHTQWADGLQVFVVLMIALTWVVISMPKTKSEVRRRITGKPGGVVGG